MNSIKNFDELSLQIKAGALENVDYDFSKLDIDQKELEIQVMNFSTETLLPAMNVLKDYYGLEVPEPLLRSALSKNMHLSYEVYEKSCGDTYVREILIDSVLKEIDVRSWPLNCESDQDVQEFQKELQINVIKHHVKFIK